MLRDDELRIDTFRRVDGGGGRVRITHEPTGFRQELEIRDGETASQTRRRVMDELEAELKSRGLMEFIVEGTGDPI